MRALLSLVRPYGRIFAYSGGSHKSIRGHCQFFELDQSHVRKFINDIGDQGVGNDIYCMIGGRFTPDQRKIIRNRSRINTELYKDILSWFINESGHSGFTNVVVPEECPSPIVIEDDETENNTDWEENKEVENVYEGGTYFFSTAQDPSEHTSVYESSTRFATALINRSAPTLLVSGGNFANERELRVEDVLPFAFPFGIGGPKMKRRAKVSTEACIQRYFRTAMPQLMRGDVIMVLNHIFGRQVSYRSGVMTCRSHVEGVPLGETLSKFTSKDFESESVATETLMKAISTSCRPLGHTTEAAQYARKCMFALMDHFGPNSLFLTITPCDECSFRVCLYARPGEWVSNPNYTLCISSCATEKKTFCNIF